MSEDSPYQNDVPTEDPVLTHTAVRDAYAQDPDAHPDLLAHMDRLAAAETLGSVAMDTHGNQLAITAGGSTIYGDQELAGSEVLGEGGKVFRDYIAELQTEFAGENPEDVNPWDTLPPDRSIILDAIRDGDYSPRELDEFITAFAPYDQYVDISDGYYEAPYLLKEVPLEKLRAAYFLAENNPDSGGVRLILGDSLQRSYLETSAAAKLAEIYELDDVLSLKSHEGAHRRDPAVVAFTESSQFGTVAMHAYRNQFDQKYGFAALTDEQRKQESVQLRDWGERFLESVISLPMDIREDLLFAAYGRTSDPTDGTINQLRFMTMLSTTAANVEQLGQEGIRLLHDKAGVVNLDYYTGAQLERTLGVLRGDATLVSHLQAGDVTVVFTDARGDHNGALQITSVTYETPSGRTLFFEVSKRSDLNRYRVLLQRLGVKPSTLVFAAHGDPWDGMEFGSGKTALNIGATSPHSRDRDLSLSDMEALPRLVEDWMQDSRGIDDNEEAKGRRRIILDSCSQAIPKQSVTRRDSDGHMTINYESTAESLVRTAAHPRLDVYAGAGVLATKPTDYGVRMLEYPNYPASNKTVPLDATKLAVDARGVLYETRVQTIELRQGAPRQEEAVVFNNDEV